MHKMKYLLYTEIHIFIVTKQTGIPENQRELQGKETCSICLDALLMPDFIRLWSVFLSYINTKKL